MSGFTFAGEHSSIYHVSLLRSPESVLPPTLDKVVVMKGRHGALRYSPDLDERRLQLDCWLDVSLLPLAIGQRQERLRSVAAWLNPLRGIQVLQFDAIRFLNAQVTGEVNSRTEAHQGLFTVEFVCSDPFWYSVSPQQVMMTTSPHSHNQQGTAPADPLLRLQGVSTGAGGQEISIAIDTQVVIYRGALSIGDWLEIDSKAKTVVRVIGSTKVSVMQYLERPIFPQLTPGMNVIAVTVSGGASWSQLEINCRNRWL